MPKSIPATRSSYSSNTNPDESPVDPKFLLLDNAITHTNAAAGPFSSEVANNYYNAMTSRSILRKSTKEKKKSGALRGKLGKLKKNKNKQHVPLVEEEGINEEPATLSEEVTVTSSKSSSSSKKSTEKRSVSFESKAASPRSESTNDDGSSTAGETSSDDSSSGSSSDDNSTKKETDRIEQMKSALKKKLGVTDNKGESFSGKQKANKQPSDDMLQLTTDGSVHHSVAASPITTNSTSTDSNATVASTASGHDILEDLRDQSSVTRGADDGSDTTVRSSNSSNKKRGTKKNKSKKKVMKFAKKSDDDDDNGDKLKEELLSLASNNDVVVAQDSATTRVVTEDTTKNMTKSSSKKDAKKLKEFESTLTNILKPSFSKDSTSSLPANSAADDPSSSSNSNSSIKPSSDSYSGIGSARSSSSTSYDKTTSKASSSSKSKVADVVIEKKVASSSDLISVGTECNGSSASEKENTPKKTSGLKSLVSKALPIKNRSCEDRTEEMDDGDASKASSKASSSSKASIAESVKSDLISVGTECNGSSASGNENTPKKTSGLKSLVSKALPIKNRSCEDRAEETDDCDASKASSKASSSSKASIAESVKISCDTSGEGSTEIELEISPAVGIDEANGEGVYPCNKKSLKEKVAEKLSATIRQNDDKSKGSTAISKKSLEQLITEALAVSDTPEHIAQFLMDHGGNNVIDDFLMAHSHTDSRVSDLNKVPVTSFEQPEILAAASSVTANSYSNGNNKAKAIQSVCSITTELKPRESSSGDASIKTELPANAMAASDNSIKTELKPQESDVSITTEQQPAQSPIKNSFSIVSAVTEIVNKKGNNSKDSASDPAIDSDVAIIPDASSAASLSINTEEGSNNDKTKKDSIKTSIKDKIKEKLNISSDEGGVEAQDQHDETCSKQVDDQPKLTEKVLGDNLGKSFDASEAVTRTTRSDDTSVSSLRNLMESKQCEALTTENIQCADEAEQLVKTTKYACNASPIDATQEIMGEIKSSVKRFFGVFPTPSSSGNNVEMILDDTTKSIPPVTSFEQDLKLDTTDSDLSGDSFYYSQNFGMINKKKEDFDDSSVISWKELASFSKES